MASSGEGWEKLKETRHRLEKCWKMDLDWTLYPEIIKEVRHICVCVCLVSVVKSIGKLHIMLLFAAKTYKRN